MGRKKAQKSQNRTWVRVVDAVAPLVYFVANVALRFT